MAYCTIDDVRSLLPQSVTKNLDEQLDETIINKTLSEIDIEYFMDSADRIIDSAVSVIYVTPLVRIVEVTRATNAETITYPQPISYTAALLSAYLIFQKVFSEMQAPNQIPEYAKSYKESAMRHLNDIRAGALDLKGQRKIGHRYLKPESQNVNKLPVEFEKFEAGKM
jgi:hypothetical protein